MIIEYADAVARATTAVATAGGDGRCEVVDGDFFEHIPSVADAYVLSWILHDWDDDHAQSILRRCRDAAAGGGRVLVVEKPYDDAFDTDLDLRMLVYFGTRERMRAEYEELATHSGLRVGSWTPLASGFSVMDCRPADER